jgi:hypothetical protein
MLMNKMHCNANSFVQTIIITTVHLTHTEILIMLYIMLGVKLQYTKLRAYKTKISMIKDSLHHYHILMKIKARFISVLF